MAVDEEFDGQSIEEIAEGKFNGDQHVTNQQLTAMQNCQRMLLDMCYSPTNLCVVTMGGGL